MGRKKALDEEKELRVPMEGEVLGIIIQMLGYDRVRVKCADGKVRLCRIPGKMKKRVWMRLGDIVLVGPWDFQADKRGDILYRYEHSEVRKLEEKGLLDWLKEEEETVY
ncbi:MAG: translation initiation factor eIF-1A [Thermoprotei archaeon]|nr:MAG: translation initiation factor eIF-1A [Thermoprotei archaeon]